MTQVDATLFCGTDNASDHQVEHGMDYETTPQSFLEKDFRNKEMDNSEK